MFPKGYNLIGYGIKAEKRGGNFKQRPLVDRAGYNVRDVRRVRYLNNKPLIFDKNLFLSSEVGDLNEKAPLTGNL